MAILAKLVKAGAKILERFDDYLLSAGYTNPNSYYSFSSNCMSCKLDSANEQTYFSPTQEIDSLAIWNKESIFRAIIGYDDIKKEFASWNSINGTSWMWQIRVSQADKRSL